MHEGEDRSHAMILELIIILLKIQFIPAIAIGITFYYFYRKSLFLSIFIAFYTAVIILAFKEISDRTWH